jgi:hypothetical protein
MHSLRVVFPRVTTPWLRVPRLMLRRSAPFGGLDFTEATSKVGGAGDWGYAAVNENMVRIRLGVVRLIGCPSQALRIN